MQYDFDILIIGGGMVGASLACALGHSDLRIGRSRHPVSATAPGVALPPASMQSSRDTRASLRIGVIEAVPLHASSQPSYDDRTVALACGSKRIFDGIGVWREITRHGESPIQHIHISDRERFGFTRLSAADAGLEALGYVVENRVLGEALYRTMQSFDNVSLMCPASMEAIAFDLDVARVTIKQDGAARELTTRLVVAADGADSPVRAAAGIEAQRVDYGQSAVVTNVTPERPHHDTAFERFTDTGPLALLPMTQGRCAVVWSARTREVDTILSWEDAEFLSRLQQRFGERLGRFMKVGRRKAYPLFLTRVSEHVRTRLALIGNAAHTVHPVAGQGFNLGLRDVATLSEVLTDALRQGRDLGDPGVLTRYADWRRRDNRVIARFTDSLIRLFSNDFLPLAVVRNLGLIAVDLAPPFKRGFIRITSGLSGRLPRLARGLPL